MDTTLTLGADGTVLLNGGEVVPGKAWTSPDGAVLFSILDLSVSSNTIRISIGSQSTIGISNGIATDTCTLNSDGSLRFVYSSTLFFSDGGSCEDHGQGVLQN